jgi:enterochelin esterase-like enzyme
LVEVLDAIAAADELDVMSLVAMLDDHSELPTCAPADAYRAALALHDHGGPAGTVAAVDLAARAMKAGVAGAGPLFASCSDRLALWAGRAQPYGTVVVESAGDLQMAPVDVRRGDDERVALGLPVLADLLAAVEERNRERATARADQPGLPAGSRFCRIWRAPAATELRRRWQAEGGPVWGDGDELTMVCESEQAPMVGPVFGLAMWPVDDGGMHALTLRVDRLAEAVFSYRFAPPGQPAGWGRPDGRWRGPAAPPAVPAHRELQGSLFEHAIESDALGEPRRVSVYRPPGYQAEERLPVVYATDGDTLAPYARRLDAGMVAGTVPRAVVVGAHCARMDTGVNLRACEYLPGFDDAVFARHRRFFLEELPSWAERTLGVAAERGRRAVFGCSDGAGHALALAEAHPDRYGHVVAFSSGMPPSPSSRWEPQRAPMVHLCAGTLEGPFHQSTEAWAAWLSAFGVPHHWTERVCGHDLIQWVEELPRALTRAFG